MMSDDPPSTPRKIVCVDTASPVATSSEDDWGLPDQIEKMSRKELRRAIRGLIELLRRAGRGEANPKGGMQLVITAVQYLSQELARRNQDRQTRTMISQTETVKKYTWWVTVMTGLMTFMTVVMMGVALWDHLPAPHTLPPPVSLPAPGPS